MITDDEWRDSFGRGCARCHSAATCIVDDEDLCDECGGEAIDVAADIASQNEVVEQAAEVGHSKRDDFDSHEDDCRCAYHMGNG